jgi:hypothetical protein
MQVGYALTFGTLLIFLLFKWANWRTLFSDVRLIPLSMRKRVLDPSTTTLIMYSGVLIGISGAPGLHG